MGKKEKRKANFEKLRIEDTKISVKFILVAIAIVLIIFITLGSMVGVQEEGDASKNTEKNKETGILEPAGKLFFSLGNSTRVSMYLPAVSQEGVGVNTLLTVEAVPGSGRTLTDIDNLLFWADTQHSIRTARRVAENITGKRMQDYNVVYTIEANASLIGGPSAGAALAIATIAALEARKMKDNVMITGTINHDGSIGPVSEILEKAKAAKIAGAGLFLVPLLQSRDVVYETTEHCEIFGQSKICTSETKPKKIDVQAEAGIEVREVASIQDAMEYFFGSF